ncbi:hypothetical protein QAD02_003365 [Eretmocerus hayati]|uniref:Uncharacterized protein n=1 Tax=Eretmocerus hayati TaxID=131215 RepID=A0ACC2NMH1_9HYME|nr:hypothetical protein QAD02_003365 [Eretmocerus hayati]
MNSTTGPSLPQERSTASAATCNASPNTGSSFTSFDPLSAEEVRSLSSSMREHRDLLLKCLRDSKDTDSKIKLLDVINSMWDAFSTVSNAYTNFLAIDEFASNCNNSLDKACESIERASLSMLTRNDVRNVTSNTTLAIIVARNLSSVKEPRQTVSLSNGKAFPIKRPERLIIGPCGTATQKYPTFLSTKVALQSAVGPVKFQLKINRVSYGRDSSIIIKGDKLRSLKLISNTAYSAIDKAKCSILRRRLDCKIRFISYG